MKLSSKLKLIFVLLGVLGLVMFGIAFVESVRMFFAVFRIMVEGAVAMAFFGVAIWAIMHIDHEHRKKALNEETK